MQISHNTTGEANDVVYRFGYDALGKATTVTVGNGTESQALSTNEYDNDRMQKLRKVVYGNGQEVENEYDDFGRLTGRKFSGDTEARYRYWYGANGAAAKTQDSITGWIEWTDHDEANRVNRVVLQRANGEVISDTKYGYNGQEHLSSIRERIFGSEYNTTLSYDWDNRPTEIRYGSADHRLRYTYDGQGRLTSRRMNNGSADHTVSYGYLGSSVEIPNAGTPTSTNLICSITQPGISYAYGYAEDTGNLTRETRTGGSYAGVTTYNYDSLGQLIRANDPKDTRGGSSGTTWIYEYDRGGNIVKKTYYPYTTGAPAGSGTEVVYSYGDPKWKDKLTAYNGTSIVSDEIGNTLTDENGVRYEWQGGRELKKMTKPDGTVVSFQYDRNGQRVRKIVTKDNTSVMTSYIMVGGRIIHITHPDMAFHFFYDGQGRPSIFKYNGGWYSYLYNLQGDVIAILDSAGNIVVEYKYDAWGATLAKTGSMAGTLGMHNPFRYRGYVFDLDTGLYYLKSRYYNPKWGRFINADVLLGKRGALLSHNLFAYCTSNPVINIDVHGQATVCVLYDGRPDEKKGGKGFPIQAAWWEKTLISQGYSVTMEGFESIDEFVQDWNNLGEYDRLIIVAHGAEGTLDCAGQRLGISPEAGSQYPITHLSSELQEKNIGMTMLFTCHGATDGYGGISLADIIADKTRSVVYAARNAKINYIPYTGMPYLSGEGLIGNLKTALWGYWAFVFPDGG